MRIIINKYLLINSLLFFSLLMSSVVFSAEEAEYRFERMWPQVEELWYLNEPSDVAVSEEGNVYVVDSAHHVVYVFDKNDDLIQKWVGGNGGFNSPRRI